MGGAGTVVLSQDKTSVTIYLGTKSDQQGTFDLTIQNVKDAQDKIVEKTTKSLKTTDTAFPTVVDVKAIGKRTVEVSFSEAMATVPTIKIIAGGITYSGTAVFNSNNTKATLTITADIPAGTHQVEVSGGTDYAGFAIDKATKDFTATAVADAPTAEITEVKDKEVTIKFSRVIKAGTFDGNGNAYIRHTYNTAGGNNETLGNDSAGGKDVTNPSSDNQTFVVTFADPLPPGTSTLYVGVKDANGTAIEDNFGNKFANASYTVNLVADLTKPEVTSVEAVDAKTIKIVYSEKVDATTGTNGAKNPSNYVLKDKDAKQIAIVSVDDAVTPADGQSFKLNTAANAIAGGNYTLEVKNVQDLAVAKNTMDAVTKSFVAADKVPPTVNTTGEVISATKVRIKFSEAMDTASVTDKNNYSVDSKVKITVAEDKKSAILDFSDVTPAPDYTSGASTIDVGRVKDEAGNFTTVFSTTVNFSGAVSTVAAKEAQVTKLNEVTVVIEDTLTVGAGAKLAVNMTGSTSTADTNWVAEDVVSSQTVGGKTYITVTLSTSVANTNTDLATGVTVATGTVNAGPVSLTQGAEAKIKNEQGLALSITPVLAKDKLAPVVITRETGDSDGNGKIDEITIEFSEKLYVGSVEASDFEVEGYTIKGIKAIDATGKKVTLELQEGTYDTGATPKVKIIGSVEDALNNATTPETTAVVATDKAAPVLLSATITTNTATPASFGEVTDAFTLVFSEAVKTAADYSADDAVTKVIWDKNFVLKDGAGSAKTLFKTTGAGKTSAALNTTGNNTIIVVITTVSDEVLSIADGISLETKTSTEFVDAAGLGLYANTGKLIVVK